MEIVARIVIVAVLVSGCGDLNTAFEGRTTRSVRGGELAIADPAVVAIVLHSPTCEIEAQPEQLLCSGTLIAERAVLTAAHCLEGLVAADLRVYTGNDLAAISGLGLAVASLRIHPDWQGRTNDIALIALEEPTSVVPIATLDRLESTAVDSLVRVVGFGADDFGIGGVKRQGAARISAIDATKFATVAAPAMSCGGDSGGPVLLALDGIEYVAGVTSGGDAACRSGVNTRVDIHREDFIREGLAAIGDMPGRRAPIEPATNYCESGCSDDLDCPVGTSCIAGAGGRLSCALDGFAPGTFTTRCDSSLECTDGICAAAAGCRCYSDCDPPSAGGGCSVGGPPRGPGGGVVLFPALIALGCLGWARGRKRADRACRGLAPGALLALAVFALGCDRSGCPSGTQAAGKVGAETYCLETGSTVRHGPYVEWWKDSKPPQRKREGSYVHGALDGTWTTWYATGEVDRVVHYRAGKLHGNSVSYHAKGNKREEGEASDGLRVGTWTFWHENGSKERDVEYLLDSMEQRWTVYSDTGVKVQSGVFVNGFKEGRFVEYYESGNKAAEGDYRQSEKNGAWTHWDDAGVELRREDWKDGTLLSPAPAAE